MKNPFDDALGPENKKEEVEHNGEKIKKEKDSFSITFSFNRKILERALFIVVILGLLTFILVNPLCRCSVLKIGKCEKTEENDEAKIAEGKEENKTKTIVKSTKDEEKTTDADKNVTLQKKEEPKQQTVISGQAVDFTIGNVDFLKNEEGNPTQIKSITFSINNKGESFKPRVEVYWYDNDSGDVIKQKKRADITYREVKQGTEVQYTIKSFDSTYFNTENSQETIELRLFDAEANKLKKTVMVDIS